MLGHQASIHRSGTKPAGRKDRFSLVMPVVVSGLGSGRESGAMGLNSLGNRVAGGRDCVRYGIAVEFHHGRLHCCVQIWRPLPTREEKGFKCRQCHKQLLISHGNVDRETSWPRAKRASHDASAVHASSDWEAGR
jgi:hypothetical protein